MSGWKYSGFRVRAGVLIFIVWGILSGVCFAQTARSPSAPVLVPVLSEPRVTVESLLKASARIDRLVEDELSLSGQSPEPAADDDTLLKRMYLDTIGRLPTPAEQYRYHDASPSGRRRVLVEKLLYDPGYADLMALRWGDILRIKSEYPSNLWPNAVQAYHRWIRDAFETAMPMDRFARSLLLSSGSNVRNPEVNFYRAMPRRDAGSAAQAAALAFMGRRYQSMTLPERSGLDRFFANLRWKRTQEWKEEIVYPDPLPVHLADLESRPAPDGWLYPDGTPVTGTVPHDPRILFADWLLAPGNPVFSRVLANRTWAWFMGRGIIEPVDDFDSGTLASPSPLLEFLASELVTSGYDLRHLVKIIILSETYARQSGSGEPSWSRYEVRRLDAEILADQLLIVGPLKPAYVSPIPEPFTFIPPSSPTITLADGSITSPFLVKFGRSPRDSGLASERNRAVTREQILYLLNSSELRSRISSGALLPAIVGMDAPGKEGPSRDKALEYVYRSLLCRSPSSREKESANAWLNSRQNNRRQAWTDIIWALVNSSEFLFRH